jgi:3-dehydroquinate synthetase
MPRARATAPAAPASVLVRAGDASYRVLVGPGLVARAGGLTRRALGAGPRRVFLVTDAGLPTALVDACRDGLVRAGFDTTHATLRADERRKSLATLASLLRAMAQARLERGEPVFALGGGVVSDVAGFAAAVYRRGVPVIHAPTTLLSMVDASVGGKTGVNLGLRPGVLRKNLVGAFHQPALVLADVHALDSLPLREFRSGLAECVKHGMLAAGVPASDQRHLFERTERTLDRVLAGDPAALSDLIRRNVAVKAGVVAGDERELSDRPSGRATLNLGHTFAHAIETLPGLRGVTGGGRPGPAGLTHGEAVGLGLVAACATAEHLGLLRPHLSHRIIALLDRIGLPTLVRGLPDDGALLAAMAHDKKVRAGHLRLVLPVAPGRVRIVEGPPPGAVRAGWSRVRG